jgi:hypothetical protein
MKRADERKSHVVATRHLSAGSGGGAVSACHRADLGTHELQRPLPANIECLEMARMRSALHSGDGVGRKSFNTNQSREIAMTTERVEFTFVVKEGTRSQPYIQVEPTVAGLDIAFALREGTTLETAHDLARRMRQMVVSVLVTVGPQPNVLNIVEGLPTKR